MMKSHSNSVSLDDGIQHRARKRFGQNFLQDQNVIDRIIHTIGPQENDHIVEIGPGSGALTDQLAIASMKLDCIELDRDLAAHLETRFAKNEKVCIRQHNVLKLDLAELTDKKKSLRIVGNLPYNISTPVMFHLLNRHELIKDMTFMLQLEVVLRMSASAGDKNYGRLSLMLQYYCDIQHRFNVPSTAFVPKPKVSSAIVSLSPHINFPFQAENVEDLKTVIRTAFNQRRKTLKNSLKAIMSVDLLDDLPLDVSLRPEMLSLADYVAISDKYTEEHQ
jgi:16S rRNA (adenine1518-N6/adenine1519-N6)-dimethyltransferase